MSKNRSRMTGERRKPSSTRSSESSTARSRSSESSHPSRCKCQNTFMIRVESRRSNPGLLRRDSTRIMKVFWHLHRLGCELSLDLERAVEDSLDLVDDGFRRSPVIRDLFFDICRSWGRVAQTLSEMHELGLLGAYLPEFAALTCLVQYD